MESKCVTDNFMKDIGLRTKLLKGAFMIKMGATKESSSNARGTERENIKATMVQGMLESG